MTDLNESRTDAKRLLDRLVIWLERHGIDCSRMANEDDAFVLAVLVATMIAFGLFAVSPWWSGFAAATIIFNGKHWLHFRKQRIKSR